MISSLFCLIFSLSLYKNGPHQHYYFTLSQLVYIKKNTFWLRVRSYTDPNNGFIFSEKPREIIKKLFSAVALWLEGGRGPPALCSPTRGGIKCSTSSRPLPRPAKGICVNRIQIIFLLRLI